MTTPNDFLDSLLGHFDLPPNAKRDGAMVIGDIPMPSPKSSNEQATRAFVELVGELSSALTEANTNAFRCAAPATFDRLMTAGRMLPKVLPQDLIEGGKNNVNLRDLVTEIEGLLAGFIELEAKTGMALQAFATSGRKMLESKYDADDEETSVSLQLNFFGSHKVMEKFLGNPFELARLFEGTIQDLQVEVGEEHGFHASGETVIAEDDPEHRYEIFSFPEDLDSADFSGMSEDEVEPDPARV